MPGDENRDSISAIADATATLARSSTVRTVLWPLLFSAVVGVGAWFSAKLDTKFEVDTLNDNVKTLSGEIAVLSSHSRVLADKIDALDAAPDPAMRKPGGVLWQLDRQVKLAQRTAVRASGEARALSSSRDRKRQTSGGEKLVAAFDNLLSNNASGDEPMTYSKAAETAIKDVAPDP